MILITGVIDLVVFIFGTETLTLSTISRMEAGLTQESGVAFSEMLPVAERIVSAWRFGEHYKMILLIPVILLFSYTRNHKNPKADLYIPAGGVVLAFLVGIEGLYQGIVINLPILIGQITELANQFFR